MQDKCEDEQAAGKPDAEPKQIDERNEFILHQVPEGYLEIIVDHGYTFNC